MKLADLKRLPVGTRLRNVESLLGPTPEDKQLRIVAKVQSNAIAFSRPGETRLSWLHFPKASLFESEPNGFVIYELDDYSSVDRENKPVKVVAARYRFCDGVA